MRAASLFTVLTAARTALAKGPFLQQVTSSKWVIGNDIWNLTQGPTYATNLYFQGSNAVGKAQGHYAGVGTFFHRNLDRYAPYTYHQTAKQTSSSPAPR